METLSSKQVKIRKPRRCWGCTIEHSPGTTMTVVNSVDEGRMTSTYWCEVCNQYWNDMEYGGSDEIMFGDFASESHYREYREKYNSKPPFQK
jgi:hypothetical protein